MSTWDVVRGSECHLRKENTNGGIDREDILACDSEAGRTPAGQRSSGRDNSSRTRVGGAEEGGKHEVG